MAKKKVDKKVEVCNSETEVARVDGNIQKLTSRVGVLEVRLNRIVNALSTAKPVKGL